MFEIADLPAVNASLNTLATILLVAGYVQIRRRRIAWHRAFMLSACVTSALFLVSYVIYHANVAHARSPGPCYPGRVLQRAHLARRACGRCAAARNRHAVTWFASALRPSRGHRLLDPADLALCVRSPASSCT